MQSLESTKNNGNWTCEGDSKVLEQSNLNINDIDLIELNEAFSSQSLAVIKELGLNRESSTLMVELLL